ncbi:MAG: DUF952 domain-containing protein [Bacteroidia bacterium]|nr:DUF952 domain-containing protein [Bacteroidia bacterium]
MALIYHLALPKDWEDALLKGTYDHPSLKEEGFIHCSTETQLLPTAQKHFTETRELVVLEISERKVKDKLKYEESRDGELFPHIYGKIKLTDVSDTRMLFRTENDQWTWD